MFNSYENKTSIPDILGWKTTIVTDMSYLFNNCSKIFSFPNISTGF